MFIKKLVTAIFLLVSFVAKPQVDGNAAIREKFMYDIIQIDEFIQRFNFEDKTKLLNYLKNYRPDLTTSRDFLMTSIFDHEYFQEEGPKVIEFIEFVCNPEKPYFISFYDDNWYAEVFCKFEIGKDIHTGSLIMKNQSDSDSASKWVIAGVKLKYLEIQPSKDTAKILSPVSHGTDFIELYNIFKDKENVLNYFPEDFKPDPLSHLAFLMYQNKIRIKEVTKIQYHFLQVPDWEFKVEYLNRSNSNAGWLVTDLNKMNESEKEIYKEDLLGSGKE